MGETATNGKVIYSGFSLLVRFVLRVTRNPLKWCCLPLTALWPSPAKEPRAESEETFILVTTGSEPPTISLET